MFGQLVYALFQENWDEHVVVGHLTAQQGFKMEQPGWERKKNESKQKEEVRSGRKSEGEV